MSPACGSQSDLDKPERPEKPEESDDHGSDSFNSSVTYGVQTAMVDARCGQQLQTQKYGQRPTKNGTNCGQIRRISQKQKLVQCWTTSIVRMMSSQ